MKIKQLRLALAAALLTCSASLGAVPISISADLTGDPRTANPDNLSVLVTVTGDTTSNVTFWTIDLDMAAAHPTVKLDEIGFNLLGGSSAYVISAVTPAWTIALNDTLQGSGNMNFAFMVSDTPSNTDNVTNSVDLTFTLTKSLGTFSEADFLTAPFSCSSDATLGCGQLGAHLQSLNAGAGQSDSGVALGLYDALVPPPPATGTAPEPGSLALVGLSIVALGFARRKRTA